MFCPFRLRVKLDALDRQCAVPDAQDDSVRRSGGNFEAVRKFSLRNNQGMIPRGGKRGGNRFENPSPIMQNQRVFAMHRLLSLYDTPTECFSDHLMPQANPKNRDPACERPHHASADAGIGRPFRSRGQEDAGGIQFRNPFQIYGVMAVCQNRNLQLPQITDQVADERVIIVDHQDRCGFTHLSGMAPG